MNGIKKTGWMVIALACALAGCDAFAGLYADIPPYDPSNEADMARTDDPDQGVDDESDATHDAGDEPEPDMNIELVAPTNVAVARGDGQLVVSWDAVPGATGYELKIDDADWLDVGDTTTYTDTDVDSPDISGLIDLTATQGDHRPHVALTTTTPTLSDATPKIYQVRATAGDRASEPSDKADGQLQFDDSWSFTWERSDDDGATFDPLATTSEPTYEDTTATPLGTPSIYRVQITTGQTDTVLTSSAASGWRLAVKQMMVTYGHTCALLTNGAVKCWGENGGGNLGYGDRASRGANPADMPPADVNVGMNVERIYGAASVTCAANDTGQTKCWGSDTGGRMGNGSTTGNIGDELNEMPPPDVSLSANVSYLSGSSKSMCALSTNVNVLCWGRNSTGILGIPKSSVDILGDDPGEMPPNIVDIGGTAKHLAVGALHACVTLTTGRVACWGSENFVDRISSLGVYPWPSNSVGDQSGEMPPEATDIVSNPTHLVAGNHHTCAIDQTSSIVCWGRNSSHQCGDPTTGDARPSDDIRPNSIGVIDMNASDFTAYNNANPTAPRPAAPIPVDIQASSNSTCALFDNGALACWGSSDDLGTTNDLTEPTVMEFKGIVHQLAQNHNGTHYCAIDTNGEALCWGADFAGQLGYGGQTIDLTADRTRVVLW